MYTSVPVVVGELTEDYKTIVLVGTGGPDELASAAKRLTLVTPLIKPTNPAGGLMLPATWAGAVQLAAEFGDGWRPGPRLSAWLSAETGRRLATPAGLSVAPPNGCVPRSYQVAAASMIGRVGGALLFDEPGTGKTVSTVLGLVERAAAGFPVVPVVIVAPNAVVDSWVEHVRTWAPGWRAIAWRGSPARRRRLVGTADVYVTSYGTASRDAGESDVRQSPLLALGPVSCVADECHKLKDQTTEQSRAVRRIARVARRNGGVFVGLSGTPITHHPGDLWPTLVALEPDAWPSRERWVGRYCLVAPGDYSSTVLGLNRATEPEFRLAIQGQHRRVAKADVLSELPPKVYSVRMVDLPSAWREAYDAMEDEMLAELPDGGELSVMHVLSQLTRLLQLSCAAADVTVTTETVTDAETGLTYQRPHTHVRLKAPSWKVDEFLEILAERPGKQIVAFAPSRQLIMLAGAAASRAGYRVGYIVGGQSAKERTATVEAFQAGSLDVCCVTTGAGGVGLTLTAAGTAVFLQRPWSLVEALQAEDRLHRIGSERHESIEIIDIVARDTIDSRVRAILRDRAEQLADVVQDPRIVAELLGGKNVKLPKKRKAA